jgi:UDP-glucose 4-epimerase
LNILVTGGAGFIGSHLAEALVRKGHRVRVLDNFYSGNLANLKPVRDDVEVVRGSCADLRVARAACKGIDMVYHEGAVPSVARSVDRPDESHLNNATATLHMLLAARDAGASRFVYAGSSSVYGDLAKLPKREDMPVRPLSPYAVGKMTGEHYLRIFNSLYGMETLSLRYFNVFGPRQNASSPYSGVISLFITNLLAGRPVKIYGDGKQSRDFTYVANVVDGNLRALTAKGLAGQSVNLATGHRVTLNQLLSKVARYLGVKADVSYEKPRAGDIRHSLADIELARKLLGYKPVVTFDDGLAETIDWYRESSGAAPKRKRG